MRTIEHHFIGGDVYMKAFEIEEGECVSQHAHEFDHITLLVSGIVALDKAGAERTVHYAPEYLFIEKGVIHGFIALNGPAKGYCCHITDCQDVNTIDQELTHEIGA